MEEEHRTRLAEAFDVPLDAVDKALAGLREAAVQEYLAMVLGDHVPHGMRDLREYRLQLLIRTVFDGHVPTDAVVAKVFHLTRTQSRALIADTLAAYRLELSDIVARTVREALSTAKPDASGESLVITADGDVASAINELLYSLDPELPPVRRRPHTVGQYLIKPAAHARLTRHYQSAYP